MEVSVFHILIAGSVVVGILVFLAIASSEKPTPNDPVVAIPQVDRPPPKQSPNWWDTQTDTLSGEEQRIVQTLQRQAQEQRRRWENQYRVKEKELQAKRREIEQLLESHRQKISLRLKKKGKQVAQAISQKNAEVDYQMLIQMHRASHLEANSTYELLGGAREVLDALGVAIVDAAKSRKSLEQRKKNADSGGRVQLEMHIRGLHDLRDSVLTPDKNRIKMERDRLQDEVCSLNSRTASLRDEIRDSCGDQGKLWFDRLEKRKRHRRNAEQ